MKTKHKSATFSFIIIFLRFITKINRDSEAQLELLQGGEAKYYFLMDWGGLYGGLRPPTENCYLNRNAFLRV